MSVYDSWMGEDSSNNKQPLANKEKAEYYLIIGTNITDEDGEKIFISLPQPLGLDTMQKSRINGEGDFQESLCRGNDLLEALLAHAKNSLEPGEAMEVAELTVKIKRRKVSQEASHKKLSFSFTKI